MILNETEAKERLESPLNLLNRLRDITNNHKRSDIPALPPTAKEVIADLDDKLAFGSIKNKAAGIMVQALDELKLRIVEVNKPKELAAIASEMSKVVNAETKSNERVDNTQYIIYAPSFVKEDHYATIHARD